MPSGKPQSLPMEESRRGRSSSHDRSTGRPDASTTSLSFNSRSTSFSSSAASSMQAATSPSTSTDIKSLPDHSASFAAPAVSSTSAVSTCVLPHPRSSSLAHSMGQVASSLSHTPSSGSAPSASSKAATLGNAAVATGHRLKRAFAARRKKTTDDVLPSRLIPNNGEKAKANEGASAKATTTLATPSPPSEQRSFVTDSTQVTALPPSPRGLKVAGKLTMQLASQMFGKKQAVNSLQSPLPPALPPKLTTLQRPKDAPVQIAAPLDARIEQRSSIIPVSPGISSALQFIRADEEMRDQEKRSEASSGEHDQVREETEKVKSATSEKEAWRKSDSTMSHHTIRPGSGPGNRTSRPVSMAESLQSNHTVVPANKRLSALLTDADFVMAEEESSQSSDGDVSHHAPSSHRAKKRRSMSLNIASTSNYSSKAQQSPPLPTSANSTGADLKHPSKSISEGVPISPPASKEAPTLTRAAASGIMTSGVGAPSTTHNIRGRLAAWTTATGANNSSSRSVSQGDRPSQQQHQHHHRSREPQGQQLQAPSLRQTAISMTSGFAPAAGLAKRAVERMGRALGGMSSSSSNSGYSSSSSLSGTAPSSYSSTSHAENPLIRVNSNQSGASMSLGGKGKPRRTPNAPSTGSWSVTSSMTSSSLSDNDIMTMPIGPTLGKCLRPPLARGKVVFGKPLAQVVNETAVQHRTSLDSLASDGQSHGGESASKQVLKDLETKRLPALVVRCAQHLLIWGVQEEGLFRVNGRPSHVAKIRSEFDSGADYDMTDCNPGDLDPHAVASVFKAYLRELPEPILTHAFVPYFEAAMAQETSTQAAQDQSSPGRPSMKGPSLPSGPRGGLPAVRKPPSLSTLAMPTFSGMRPPSESLLNALRSLIAQLPIENRDLIRVVADLIKATAKESKATKMPLSNLLLVFCPSLNMNPPLLRVLCEAESIWGPKTEDPEVIDIRRESVVLDIKAPASTNIDDVELQKGEDGDMSKEQVLPTVETIYVDAVDHISIGNSSVAYSSDTSSLSRDDISYVSTSEGDTSIPSRQPAASPQLSSSVESLSTPSTSTDDQSFDDGEDFYAKRPARGSPIIADSTSSSPLSTSPGRPTISSPILNTARPPTISSPLIGSAIHFPGTGGIPPTPTSAKRKRSFPTLSLPSLSPFTGSSSPSPTSSASSPSVTMSKAHRLRKPSLHLLLSKRSASSPMASPVQEQTMTTGSPYLQPPRSASDSSVSTPISAVTAPQSSTYTLPPVLKMQIDSSLGLGIDVDEQEPRESVAVPIIASPPTSGKAPRPLPEIPLSASNDSSAVQPVIPRKGTPTPIADRYRSGSNASLPTVPLETSSGTILRPAPHLRSSYSKASISSTSSNHLGLLDDNEDREDWTKSVLLAAEAGNWSSLH